MASEELEYTESTEEEEINRINEIISKAEDIEISDTINRRKKTRELVPGLEVISESKKSYRVRDAEGNVFWICKDCFNNYGAIRRFDTPHELAKHVRIEHKDDSVEETLVETTQYSSDYIPTADEEITNERAKKLLELLLKAPGVDKRRAQWVALAFQKSKRLQNNPENLHRYLKTQFKKLSDEDIYIIVSSVFEEEQTASSPVYYEENKEETKVDYSDIKKEDITNNTSSLVSHTHSFMSSLPSYGGLSMTDMLNFMTNLLNLMDKFKKDDPEKMYYKAKAEMYEQQLQELRQRFDKMEEYVRQALTQRREIPGTANEWTFLTEGLHEVSGAIRSLGGEISKFGRLLITLYFTSKRKAYTDEDVLKLIEKEIGEDYIA